jgi:hypothetical protein
LITVTIVELVTTWPLPLHARGFRRRRQIQKSDNIRFAPTDEPKSNRPKTDAQRNYANSKKQIVPDENIKMTPLQCMTSLLSIVRSVIVPPQPVAGHRPRRLKIKISEKCSALQLEKKNRTNPPVKDPLAKIRLQRSAGKRSSCKDPLAKI